MNRVLVTGAESPAGGEIVRLLLEAGYAVRALLAPEAAGAAGSLSEAEIVQGTLEDASLAAALMRGVEGIVHMYVRGVPPEGVSDSENLRHNLACALNLCQAAARAEVSRFVCGSSSSVYPNDSHLLRPLYYPVDENHPLRPLDAYALARLGAEQIAWAYARSAALPVVVIRESGVVAGKDVLNRWTAEFVATVLEIGQQHPASSLWAPEGREAVAELRACSAAMADQPCAVTDREGRPWLYQVVDYRDLAAGAVCALTHPNAVGNTYNLAAAQPISFVYAARLLAEALGKPLLEWRAPTRWVYDLDCTKARTEIGYEPKWTIEKMLAEAVA